MKRMLINATQREELRVAMEAAPNKRSYIRLNAIRSLLLGIIAVLARPFGEELDIALAGARRTLGV